MSTHKMSYTISSDSAVHQGLVTMTASRSTSQTAVEGATATWVRQTDARYSDGDRVLITPSA